MMRGGPGREAQEKRRPYGTTSGGCFLLFAMSIIVGRGLLLLLVVCGKEAMAAATPNVNVNVGVNWGTQSSHRLPPQVVARMLKSNGIRRVKLLGDEEGDGEILRALLLSGMEDVEVMLGISSSSSSSSSSDEMRRLLAEDPEAAKVWVQKKVVPYKGMIRYVALGNNNNNNNISSSYTYSALKNVQMALDAEAGLGSLVKATVPLDAHHILSFTSSSYSAGPPPSQSTFRADIASHILQIVEFLALNDCPFTINIYPYLSLYAHNHFPVDYAFFSSSSASSSSSKDVQDEDEDEDNNNNNENVVVVADGPYTYRNVFDTTYDSIVVALSRAGYSNMSIIVGGIGWPTDGDVNANVGYAQKFNQGLIDHLYSSNGGTPRRPNQSFHVYLFTLIDEDLKSIGPGNFERHWGIFNYDGTPKYSLSWRGRGRGRGPEEGDGKPKALVAATGVKYLKQRWCVLDTSAQDLSALAESVTYACSNSDCTSLGYGCSCNQVLDANGNASYAFNQYFQRQNQDMGACSFNGLGRIVTTNPSMDTCTFNVQLAYTSNSSSSSSSSSIPCKFTAFLNFSLASLIVATLF